jgi:hypothetical protein
MITFLTLTYKREHLLEECIYSFLLQENIIDHELLIINDNPNVEYILDHPNINIINVKKRFESISDKLKFGFDNSKFNYIYRLDDDDLLAENSIINVENNINSNLGFDIYRSKNVHFFVNNKYEGLSSNVNNGNLYTKEYINNIQFPNTSFGEDYDITFKFNAKIYQSDITTMIYRWGMNTMHISGLGSNTNEYIMSKSDEILKNNKTGKIYLSPNFKSDYYSIIR